MKELPILNNKHGGKQKLIFLFVVFLSISISNAQSVKIDSLIALLNTELSIDKRTDVYQQIIINLWLNYPDSAISFAHQSYVLAKRENNLRSMTISTRMLGGAYVYKGDYDSSLYYNKKSYALSSQMGDSVLQSNAANNIGFAYYNFGSYAESFEYLLKAKNIKQKLKLDYGLGQTLNNLGLIYTKLQYYDKAREYFSEALVVAERTKDLNITLYSNNNIGFTYLKQGKTKKAEEYFLKSLMIAETITNYNWHATSYSGMAQVKLQLGKAEEAKALFLKSLKLRTKIGDKSGISELYYFLSMMKMNVNDLDSAFYFAHISQSYSDMVKSKSRRLENLELFKRLYLKKKRYDSAIYFQDQFALLRDSILNQNLARNLSEVQMKVQEESNKQSLSIKEEQLKRRSNQNNFLMVLTILVVLFATVTFWFYKKQKDYSSKLYQKNKEIVSQSEEIIQQREALQLANVELEKAKNKIQEQNERLEEFNKGLRSTVEQRTIELERANLELKIANLELDNFIYKSSHDMKGPLVRLLGICHVALMDVQNETARDYFTRLHKTAQQLNDIFDRLKAVSDINAIQIKSQLISFNEILERVKERLKPLEGYESITLITKVDDKITFHSDNFLIETIFYNMLENAIKFQKTYNEIEKFVKVRVKAKKDRIIVYFKDNGIGIRKEEQSNIFEMFSKAALEHQSTGLGLYIVKQSLAKIKGSIKLLRSDENSTKFEVSLPMR